MASSSSSPPPRTLPSDNPPTSMTTVPLVSDGGESSAPLTASAPSENLSATASPSVNSNASLPILPSLPKKRRTGLDALRFDSPGAAFRSDLGDPASGSSSDSDGSRRASGRRSASAALMRKATDGSSVPDAASSAAASSSSIGNKKRPASPLKVGSSSDSPMSPTRDGEKRQRRPSAKLREQSAEAGPSSYHRSTAGPSSPKRPSSASQLPTRPFQTYGSSRKGRPSSSKLPSEPQAASSSAAQDPDEAIRTRREALIRDMQSKLDGVHGDHDDLVRELFHLTKFVTYVGFDPEVAKEDRSHVFEHFKLQYNLEAHLGSDGPSGSKRSTRRNVSSRMNDLALSKPEPLASPQPTPVSGKGKGKEVNGAAQHSLSSQQVTESETDDMSTDSPRPRKPGRPPKATASLPSTSSPDKVYGKANQLKRPYKRVIMDSTASSSASEAEQESKRESFKTYLERRRRPPRPLPSEPPVLEATHPTQVPQPHKFGGSLAAFWGSFRSIGEGQEDISPWQLQIVERRDVKSHARIDQARLAGKMPSELSSLAALRPAKEPFASQRSKGHHTALLEVMVSQSAALRQDARIRRQNSRKIARMIQLHWTSRLGDSEKEKKAHERHLRSLAKWTVKEVNKQWKLAVNVVRAKRAKQEKLERERKGREELSRILEQSTRYLGEREEDLKRGRVEGMDEDDEEVTDSASSQDEEDGVQDDEDAESLESDVYSLEDDGSQVSEVDSSKTSHSLAEEGQTNGDEGLRETSHLSELLNVNGHHKDTTEDSAEEEVRSSSALLDLLDEKPSPPRTNGSIVELDDSLPPPSSPTRFSPRKSIANGVDALDDADTPLTNGHVSPALVTEEPASPSSEDFVLAEQQEQDEDALMDDEMLDENADDDSEDEGLMNDADMPIEELMKRYGYGTRAGGWARENGAEGNEEADRQDSSDQSEDEDMEAPASASPAIVELNGHEEVRESSPAAEQSNGSNRIRSGRARSSRSRRSSTRASSVVTASDVDSTSRMAGSGKTRSLHPPFLLRGSLRPYQQTGFEWLASLYANNANGILADEMGLGKTIQTISLLAHLACDKGVWGPHLVIAPTSVMLNWEVEFKKFLPGFKILSYYGSQKERKEKRIGWNTEHQFNVCITSYQLVLADQHIFRRKPWVYMILDEAHHIKNFRSQRWQTLLGFNSQRRLLLTGTPLQNNLMDLWSLMYFLMPNGLADVPGAGAFANMKDFQEWFSNPLDKAVEAGSSMDEETRKMVGKLHTILRPFLLRRLKSEVEKELPRKYEHVIRCRLSKRQRFLYNDFMSRAKTKESLASGNYLSIINCLMQLRKVCNHPDLFEVRPINTAFAMERSVAADFEIKDLLVRRQCLQQEGLSTRQISLPLATLTSREHLTPFATRMAKRLDASDRLPYATSPVPAKPALDTWTIEGFRRSLEQRRHCDEVEDWHHRASVNRAKVSEQPIYGSTLLDKLGQLGRHSVLKPLTIAAASNPRSFWSRCDNAHRLVTSLYDRGSMMQEVVDRFAFVTPSVMAKDLPRLALPELISEEEAIHTPDLHAPDFDAVVHRAATKLQIAFPDSSLLQYDCGKLQELDHLMRRLKEGSHRILIFTQMTKVLDILESFLSFHGYRYLRLDGSTRIDRRQALTEKFNRDPRIDAFILSTRSGGLGINLTGADTVLFYDLDWNSAIEAQCMDRAHRIGQTRDVHIYRFVSIATIEENMLKKADQKRLLDNVVIQGGEFTTEHLKRGDWRDMLDEGGKSLAGVAVGEEATAGSSTPATTSRCTPIAAGGKSSSALEEERALLAVEDEEDRLAAQRAREEMALDEDHDVGDFAREDVDVGSKANVAAEDTIQEQSEGQLVEEAAVEEAEEEDEGTVDDYMLKFVEEDWYFFSGGDGGFKV